MTTTYRKIEANMSSFTKTEAGRELALENASAQADREPSDVADVIAFLGSDAARWTTGATIPADGGSKL
ncbi:MAG TPA: SDR family oxidoreductase [Chthoniobacterales bacterium]|nr:SDR family oxidoreductase [Chthoniobacterales bacterium]